MKTAEQLSKMTVGQVLMHTRYAVKQIVGDAAENETRVYASRGYYFIEVPGMEPRTMRRWKIPEYLKELKRDYRP